MSEQALDSKKIGWRFLYSRRWFGYWAMLLIFSVTCVFLGNWQFARRAEAQAEIARIDKNYDAAPIPLGQALPDLEAFDEGNNKWLPVVVTGKYLATEQLLVRNRPKDSRVGFEILSPLILANGSVFVVDRGWIPAAKNSSKPSEIPLPPSGEVTVIARLKAGEPVIEGRSAVGNTLGTINLAQLQSELKQPTYLGAYGLLVSEKPAAVTGELSVKPERDEGPHLSYALQWYVFIIIAVVGTVFGARREYRNLNSADASSPEGRQKGPTRKRRQSDAEIEDALIEARDS